MILRVGTRGSALALRQVEFFISRLKAVFGSKVEIQILTVRTSGDEFRNVHLASIGGKGLFLKELEEKLIAKEIDVAVHSMKDVPAFFDERLTIQCFLPREDPRDAFLSNYCKGLAFVPKGSKIATSSIRRHYQLKNIGLDSVMLRGNLTTRIAKIKEVTGMIIATSGLNRLNLSNKITEIIPAELFLPAIGQGVICVQSRIGDLNILKILLAINDKSTEICVEAERGIIKSVNGDCFTPLAGLATLEGKNNIKVVGMLAKGGKLVYKNKTGPATSAKAIGTEIGLQLLGK